MVESGWGRETRLEGPQEMDGVAEFALGLAGLHWLKTDPAVVMPLVERREDRWEVDLPGAEDHRPAPAGEGAGHGVGSVDGGDVAAKDLDGLHWIVSVYEQ